MATAAATMLRVALDRTPAASCAAHGAGSRSCNLVSRSITAAQQSGHHRATLTRKIWSSAAAR
ncbi:hypothetical protein F511_20523 [Dorcoceras hygrometricum]|uniref:Uncharacterized protein n=1 Tax=Dorcoceras hygrometricum TaxID=472368 RepID=A0A2Z7B2P3_9LAMI|nr:hypothetical protein F511_20523 [Dorcoceras hygrometricum]